MPRRSLAVLLSLSLLCASSEAKAGAIEDIFKAIILIAVVGTATAGVAETLTAVATYKNYRSASRKEEASGGWVGVGAVGGLANIGLGGYLIYDGLPSSYGGVCSDNDPKTGEARPYPCTRRVPAHAGELIAGTLFLGFGAFALGTAIQAVRAEPAASPAAGSPGATPASIGLVLPPLRF